MTTMTLYFAPDSCPRVPLIALEEIGHPYTLEVVALMKGQHRSPEYLALNPKGKVPTLVVDGEPLTKNVAILTWLAERFPHANHGERWSIVDAYINWVWFRVTGTEFDATGFANLARHDEEMKQRPAVIRALSINAKVSENLAARGLAAKFSGPGAVTAANS
jgi:glutathione S-transferase